MEHGRSRDFSSLCQYEDGTEPARYFHRLENRKMDIMWIFILDSVEGPLELASNVLRMLGNSS